MTHRTGFRLTRCASAAALALALSWAPAHAAEAHLDAGTIFAWTIDDVKAFDQGMRASDYGAFAADPAVQQIWQRVKAGVSALIAHSVRQASEDGAVDAESKAVFDNVSQLIADYWDALRNNSTGSFGFSVGIRNDAEGQIQPQFICHHQGDDRFVELHQRLMGIVGKLDPSLTPTTFSLRGVEFRGIQFPPIPALPGVVAPDGFFWGRSGNDYYLGISRAGLDEYVGAAAGAEVANPRLASSPFYQRAVADCGRGQVRTLLHFDPLWQLFDRYGAMVPDRDTIQTFMDVLALRQFHGYYGTMTVGARAIEQAGLIGVDKKVGLWSLMPDTNEPVVMPPHLNRSALMALATRFHFERILPLGENAARALGGDEAVATMNQFLDEGKVEAGVDIRGLLAGLEGSMFCAQPSGNVSGVGLEGLVTQASTMGLKLRDPALFRSTLEKIVSLEPSLWRTQVMAGQTMHVFGPPVNEGDEQFGPEVPRFGIGVDGDWLLFGMPLESLETVLATRQTEGEASRISSDPRFTSALAMVGGSGVMGSYSDAGALLANTFDSLRPMMSFLPLMLGGLGDDPEVQKLVDPRNIPDAELVKRYFGVSVAVMQSVDHGWRLRGVTPRVSPLPTAETKPPEKF
ncbi:MAG: hypothetical protein AB7O52_11370 [Planctomycetota bacterium]